MNNSSLREEVVLTDNGEVYSPINIGMASVIAKIVFCSIGMLMFLIMFPSPSPSLVSVGYTENRVTFSYSESSCAVCHAYVAVIFVPQGLLLINMLLALIDRYLAINYPLQHREKMTVRLASVVMILSSSFTVFFIKFIYIVGLSILRCEILLLHVKVTSIIFVFLFVSCTAMNIVLYRQTRILLRESRIVATTRDDSVVANNQSSTVVTSMAVHVGKKKLGQLEMEATQTLIISMTSLCVMPCLNVVLIGVYFSCRLVFGQSVSSNFNGMLTFVTDMCLIPAIYGPVIFLVRNKELRAAWTCQIIR